MSQEGEEMSKKKGRLVREAKFLLEKGQTLYVEAQSLGLAPGLHRVFVENKGKKVEVFAYAAHGPSKFRFVTGGSGKPGKPTFEIINLSSAETFEEILQQKFWGQFTFGKLVKLLKDKKFERVVNRRIKKLVRNFESQSAQELNSIKPSKK